jgi:hypothetical protein
LGRLGKESFRVPTVAPSLGILLKFGAPLALATATLLNAIEFPGLGTNGARTFANGLVVEATDPGLTEIGFSTEGTEFGASTFAKGLLPLANGTGGSLTCCGANTFAKGFGVVVGRGRGAARGGADPPPAGGKETGFTGASTVAKGLGPEGIDFGKSGFSAVPWNELEPTEVWGAAVGNVFTITGNGKFVCIGAGAVPGLT